MSLKTLSYSKASGKTFAGSQNSGSGSSAVGDPFWYSTTALLLGNGANAQTNSTFLDSSSNNATVTVAGNVAQGAVAPFAGVGSAYFPGGTSVGLTMPGSSSVLGSGQFCIECWVNFAVINSNIAFNTIIQNRINNLVGTGSWSLYLSATGAILFDQLQTPANLLTSSSPIVASTWNHIAITRDGSNTLRAFLNGVVVASTTSSFAFTSSVQTNIGLQADGSAGTTNAYFSGLRVVTGSAVYTGTFTPSTTPLTAISGTSILLNFNNAGVVDSTGLQNATLVGATKIATGNSKFGGSSIQLTATSDYITLPASSGFSFGTGEFTIEAWVYATAHGTLFSAGGTLGTWNANGAGGFSFGTDGTGNYALDAASNVFNLTSPTVTPSLNTWNHLAISRVGGTIRTFLNGILNSTTTFAGTMGYSNAPFAIGRFDQFGGGRGGWTGYIDDLRITKGVGRYTVNFTVPSAQLPATYTALTYDPYWSYTSLLLHGDAANNQNNATFVDSSTNNFTFTAGGVPAQGGKSPFPVAQNSEYNVAVNGGSLYFNGSTDYLTTASNANLSPAGSDFTIEAWFYLNTTGAEQTIVAKHNNQAGNGEWALTVSATSFPTFYYSTTGSNLFNLTSSTSVSANTWYHVAMVRSGSTFTLYLNGVSVATGSAVTIVTSATALNIGRYLATAASAALLNGYVSNLRIVKGSAVYTTGFTPPTVPLTAIANTQLLMSGTNAAIIDSTAKHNPAVGGDTKTMVAVNKFGGSSLYFDGNGDYIKFQPNAALNMSSGDFTIEAWVYPTATSSQVLFLGQGDLVAQANTSYQFILYAAGGCVAYVGSTTYTAGTLSPTANVWSHVAMVRNGSAFSIYLNGTQVGTTTISGAINDGLTTWPPTLVGDLRNNTSNFVGYIDDFRITKGIARYTSNFVPPASAFANR